MNLFSIIISSLAGLKYIEKKKELEQLANIDENDNPVLMLVKLKE